MSDKNYLLLKDKMGLMMKKFNIFGVHLKIQFLGGWVNEKPILRGEWPKKGGRAWTICRFRSLGGGLGKKEGDVVFEERGVDTSMPTP